jgi:hypothetical protein
MAQRHNDVEIDGLGRGELPDKLSLPIERCFTHMTRQQGPRLRPANDIHARHYRGEREREYDESSIHDFSLCNFKGLSLGRFFRSVAGH